MHGPYRVPDKSLRKKPKLDVEMVPDDSEDPSERSTGFALKSSSETPTQPFGDWPTFPKTPSGKWDTESIATTEDENDEPITHLEGNFIESIDVLFSLCQNEQDLQSMKYGMQNVVVNLASFHILVGQLHSRHLQRTCGSLDREKWLHDSREDLTKSCTKESEGTEKII